jgi:hypothetical protein
MKDFDNILIDHFFVFSFMTVAKKTYRDYRVPEKEYIDAMHIITLD